MFTEKMQCIFTYLAQDGKLCTEMRDMENIDELKEVIGYIEDNKHRLINLSINYFNE